MIKNTFYSTIYLIWEKWKEYDKKEATEKTWCNYFVVQVCNYIGYMKFNYNRNVMDTTKDYPMTANQIYETLKEDKKNWILVSTETAIKNTTLYNLIIAAKTAKNHGHVCILLPGKGKSGKWKKEVPLCANIGRTNFWNKTISYAFKTEPEYYLYIGEYYE